MEGNITIVYWNEELQIEQKRADKCSIILGRLQDVNGDNYRIIFCHIRQYIDFIEKQEREERGLWEKILDHLVKKTRVNAGRKEAPTYTIMDLQSLKTVTYGDERGIDGGKTKGRKRHIVDVFLKIMKSLLLLLLL